VRILNAKLDKKRKIARIAGSFFIPDSTSYFGDRTLELSAGGAAIFTLAAVLGGLASTLALTGILALAAVVAGLASALSFT
jgi:hypothetical protein